MEWRCLRPSDAIHDHIRNKYGAEPEYITMNAPRLQDVLDALGIENPIVCANVNSEFRPIAMSVLASGAIPPREAIEYVCGQPGIDELGPEFQAAPRPAFQEES